MPSPPRADTRSQRAVAPSPSATRSRIPAPDTGGDAHSSRNVTPSSETLTT
jgi:hypothetical protein